MFKQGWIIFFLSTTLILLLGCISTSTMTPEAFTNEWKHQLEKNHHENKTKKEAILHGRPSGPKTYVYRDEKGNPQLAIGGAKGLEADIKFDSGNPNVGIKYKIGIGGRKR